MMRFLRWFTNLYPVWLVGIAIVAFGWPQAMGFTWLALNSDLSLLREPFQRNLQNGRSAFGRSGAQ